MSRDVSRRLAEDQALDAEQLRTKYDGLAHDSEWGEHPNYPVKDWQAEVQCKRTLLGYWDWVVIQFKLKADKDKTKTVLADAENEEITELQAADSGNQGA